MKTLYTLSAIALASAFLTGCSLVSCNHVFPKLEWYWSADAKARRKEHQMEKQWENQRTNQPVSAVTK